MKRILAFLALTSVAVAGTWMASPGKGSHGTAVAPPTPDLLWWKMTNGSGTTVTATVGINGTTDATWITGKSGSGFALSFNGSSQDLSTVATEIFYGVNTATVCGWVWVNSNVATQVIWESSENFNTSSDVYVCFVDAGTLYSAIRGTGGNRGESITAPATGAWYHLAVVYNNNTAAGDIKVYINGTEQSTTTYVNDKTAAAFIAEKEFNVGARNAGGLFLAGRIDDVRIYLSELTGAQITAVMNDPQ